MNKQKNPRRRLYILLVILAVVVVAAATSFCLTIRKARLDEADLSKKNETPTEVTSTSGTTASNDAPQDEVTTQEPNTTKPAVKPTTTPQPATPPTTTTSSRPTKSPMNKEVSIGDKTKKRIALTLDAGSSATQTPEILQILKDNNIHATFFLTGKWAEQNPDMVRAIVAGGHTIGNHTYDHKDLTTLTDPEIKEEFDKTETIVKGIAPTAVLKPYFRPPYGARNQHVWDYAASLGYQSIYWTVDAWDWKTDATNDIVKQRIYDGAQNGAIILMHVGDDITPAVLPEVIHKLQSEGYTIGTLESVLQ